LPTMDELVVFWKNRSKIIHPAAAPNDNWYWSSEEYRNDRAKVLKINDGQEHTWARNSKMNVRAVRTA